ncbi:unnamed protein product [Ambrosiozyma monospora]|uniref:Unnamed protein product n=1 Tax=Ambrosiozyma monospora TaxID=43982 RepID=A0ACB5T9A4_AMBMO|nr:unnamed protein product [Ambrosiozyma monospora]
MHRVPFSSESLAFHTPDWSETYKAVELKSPLFDDDISWFLNDETTVPLNETYVPHLKRKAGGEDDETDAESCFKTLR